MIISSMRRRRLLVLERGTASLPATTLVHQPAIAGCRPLLIRPPGGLNAQQRMSARPPLSKPIRRTCMHSSLRACRSRNEPGTLFLQSCYGPPSGHIQRCLLAMLNSPRQGLRSGRVLRRARAWEARAQLQSDERRSARAQRVPRQHQVPALHIAGSAQ